jgi:hypothetical protein
MKQMWSSATHFVDDCGLTSGFMPTTCHHKDYRWTCNFQVVDDLFIENLGEDKMHPLWKNRVLKTAGLITNAAIN